MPSFATPNVGRRQLDSTESCGDRTPDLMCAPTAECQSSQAPARIGHHTPTTLRPWSCNMGQHQQHVDAYGVACNTQFVLRPHGNTTAGCRHRRDLRQHEAAVGRSHVLRRIHTAIRHETPRYRASTVPAGRVTNHPTAAIFHKWYFNKEVRL